jgi:amino acid adenylation domain-containing protein
MDMWQKDSEYENVRPGLDIAVIGMAGRFPGANNLEEFWDNLKNGRESIAFFSDQELIENGTSPRELENLNYVKAKGYMVDIEYFDACFFGYSPKEAEKMDPQTRVLHECAWHALEQAGYNPYSYDGAIGCYLGARNNSHWQLKVYFSEKGDAAETFNLYNLSDKDQISTRISYKLNLTGPSFQLVTQCSTSLVAVHQACQSLINHECDMALAGGISSTLPPKHGYLYQEGMLNSPDGHLRAFDAAAKGTVFGNGAGIVLLKPIDQAIADGDYIMAVVKSTFINNDGNRKVGYTAPSTEGQAEAIKAALELAEIEPRSIGYIETHGTATSIGDIIEIDALKLAFNHDEKHFCRIGSVKTNIGHLGIAAGIAGFIKTVLVLKHRLIPPGLHFETPNPKIDFENSPFYVNRELTEWKSNGHPLRAGVSSFGVGGTNAHVVLQEWPEDRRQTTEDRRRKKDNRKYQLILLSARTTTALERMRENLANYFQKNPGINLAEAAYTLQVGRRRFQHRQAFVCSDVKEAMAGLKETGKSKISGITTGSKPGIIFMFPGQGSQYVNMGWDLYRTEPVFQEEMNRCFEILKPLKGCDIKEILYPEEIYNRSDRSYIPNINQTEMAQPVLFSFEYALARLLMSWGIKPCAMIGHSIGEYVAACLSGVFSLEDALALVAARGQLVQHLPAGVMLSVPMAEKDIIPLLSGNVSLAAVNTFSRCVISGPGPEIERLETYLKKEGCRCSRLHTSHAFHSYMMDPILTEFQMKVETVSLNPPGLPYISNITGDWVGDAEAVSPVYWADHLRETVRFARGIETLDSAEMGSGIFMEVGPGNVLSTFARQCFSEEEERFVINLVRHPQKKVPDDYYLFNNLAELWLYGGDIDWTRSYLGETRRRIPLPLYPFERKRYWIDEDPLREGYRLGARESLPGEKAEPLPIEVEDKDRKKKKGALKPRPNLTTPYAAPAPGDGLEETLVSIWRNYFGFEKVGVHDDFFELGGDSLKAVTIITRMQKAFNVEIPTADFFQHLNIKELADYIRVHAVKKTYSGIPYPEAKDYYELSSVQRRMYVLQQLKEENITYNESFALRVKGNLQTRKLEDTFRQLIKRHESFRTSFKIIAGEPVQQVHGEKEIDFEIEYFYLEQHQFEAEVETIEKIIRDFIRPFDLEQAPLLRVGIIKASEENHLFIMDMHHIITDGTSHGILIEEFLDLYHGEELPGLVNHYKDFAQWENQLLQAGEMGKQEAYWQEEFPGEVPELNLPVDYPRPALLTFEGNQVKDVIGKEETSALRRLATGQNSTLFMALLAVFNIFLFKLSGQEEIVCGTVIAGRRRVEFQKIIGMFVNTLAMRNYPGADKAFIEFLKDIRKKTLETYENQDYPFENLVEKIVKNRDTSRNPLFDVLFVLQNMEIPEIQVGGLKVEPYEHRNITAKFDLSLLVVEVNNNLLLTFEYNTRLFRQETVERLIRYFKRTVSGVLENAGQKISDLQIISEEEKNQLLFEFNDTSAVYPGDKTIHQLFAEQVQRTPDHVALVGPNPKFEIRNSKQIQMTEIQNSKQKGTTGLAPLFELMSITYRQLNETSNQLACLLKEKGVEPDTIVGIMVGRSVQVVVCIVGILKAGGAYLPIDPDYPQERINYMLADSKVLLLIDNPSRHFNFQFSIFNFQLSMNEKTRPTTVFSNPQPAARISQLAYIIYTSGSTGSPKGVMVGHRNVVRLVKNTNFIDFLPDDRLLQTGALDFDASTFEIWGALLNGLTFYLAPRENLLSPGSLKEIITRDRITTMWVTAPLFNQVVQSDEGIFAGLRNLLVGGDVLSPPHINQVRRRFPRLKIINGYGPTENTTFSTTFLIEKEYKENIPIGKPIANSTAYIVNKNHRLQPIGIVGELYVGGDGVSRGYLNNPELTAEKFMKNPFTITTNDLYNTGDLAKWLPDGNIRFMGRIDHQVKIRGFRIELGEIETHLLSHDRIKEAVVLPEENEGKDKYLCAYIVSDNQLIVSELREYLTDRLPDYMIPTGFVQVEKIPLTSNGKVDRKALPGGGKKLATGVEYVAPKSDKEIIIADIWKEVLKLDKIGIHDNFFDLGGTSVDMVRVNSRLKDVLEMDLSIVTMYKYTTISSFSQFLDNGGNRQHLNREERRDTIRRGKADKKKMRDKRMRRRNES